MRFTTERERIWPGDTVTVVGAGPVGVLSIQCAGLYGTAAILALDRVQDRLDLARSLGTIAAPVTKAPWMRCERRPAATRRTPSSRRSVGSRASLAVAVRLVRSFGTVAAAGVFLESDVRLSRGRMFASDLTLGASMGNIPAVIHRVFRLLKAGKLHPEALISHEIPLGAAEEAYRRFDRREALKMLLWP